MVKAVRKDTRNILSGNVYPFRPESLESAQLSRGDSFMELEDEIFDLDTLAGIALSIAEENQDTSDEAVRLSFCVKELRRRSRALMNGWLEKHNAACAIEQAGRVSNARG